MKACCASETAEHREVYLRNRKVRDRARHTAQMAAKTAERSQNTSNYAVTNELVRLLRTERPDCSMYVYVHQL